MPWCGQIKTEYQASHCIISYLFAPIILIFDFEPICVISVESRDKRNENSIENVQPKQTHDSIAIEQT